MKDRILAYLDDFSHGRSGDLAEELKAELGLDDITFQERSQEAQANILHKYSQFSISTIDAFFQKVIRSFTREAGLLGDYRLEIDQDTVLTEVIDNLIDELGTREELTRWVVEFARENLENERAWDIRNNLIAFANEIFREDFKLIEDPVMQFTQQPGFFKNLLDRLRAQKYQFIHVLKGKAQEALAVLHGAGLSAADFKYAGGIYNFFVKVSKINKVSDFDEKAKGKRPEKEFQESKHWPDKQTPHVGIITQLAETQLIPLLNEILAYRAEHYTASLSAEVALNNFYSFGLIADISRKLKEYKDEHNMMLLADAPKFLNGVIQDSDTPFIYEKVGSFYRNYLIDEFQDTSGLQWQNFLPLLSNSLDQGYPSLVVGDVKQAIYRWRGGDLRLLQEQVEQHIGSERVAVKELSSNYRSAQHVVNFNNAVFAAAATWMAKETGHPAAEHAYGDVAQQVFKEAPGFVRTTFITELSKDEKWKDEAMMKIPAWLEELQDAGASLKDMAILVRTNAEGQQIVAHLLQYRHSEQARPDCRYDVISNESLRLDGAASVNLLLAAMRYLLNPYDAIARAQLSYEYTRLQALDRTLTEVFAVSDQTFFERQLPDAFTKQKGMLKKLPLFELSETLIDIFELGKQHGELAYLQAFQNLVLDFYSRERNDLGAYLEWWDENKHKQSIQVSGEIDAVQILTIHKSKGLQFRYVLIPFCAWSLDHESWKSPNLWVLSKQPPFDEAGFLPVKYTSALKETYFADYYEEELTRAYLDNLNLLYVALTRAEYGLTIYAPHPQVKGAKKTAGEVLYQSLLQADTLQSGWDGAQQHWAMGELQAAPVNTHMHDSHTLTLNTYTAGRWRNKLVIRESAKTYFGDAYHESMEKLQHGVHIHAVLSRIEKAEDVDDTLRTMIREGLITQTELPHLQLQFQKLFQDELIASWFSGDWDIRTEVPILLPGGKENRIDRLMIRGKQAIVVDFKTGAPAKTDQPQVLEYMNILRQMNYLEVEGYLLYLHNSGENSVVSVQAGKVRAAKKVVENQLGLGL